MIQVYRKSNLPLHKYLLRFITTTLTVGVYKMLIQSNTKDFLTVSTEKNVNPRIFAYLQYCISLSVLIPECDLF